MGDSLAIRTEGLGKDYGAVSALVDLQNPYFRVTSCRGEYSGQPTEFDMSPCRGRFQTTMQYRLRCSGQLANHS